MESEGLTTLLDQIAPKLGEFVLEVVIDGDSSVRALLQARKFVRRIVTDRTHIAKNTKKRLLTSKTFERFVVDCLVGGDPKRERE